MVVVTEFDSTICGWKKCFWDRKLNFYFLSPGLLKSCLYVRSFYGSNQANLPYWVACSYIISEFLLHFCTPPDCRRNRVWSQSGTQPNQLHSFCYNLQCPISYLHCGGFSPSKTGFHACVRRRFWLRPAAFWLRPAAFWLAGCVFDCPDAGSTPTGRVPQRGFW